MRNDLTVACEKCALRLPSTEKRCPRCEGDLHLMRDIGERGLSLRMFSGVRPYRDLVLFVPVIPFIGVAVWAAVDMTTLELSFVPVIQILFLFVMTMLVLGAGWLVWAAIVMMASALWNGFRPDPLRVVVMPIPRHAPPKPLWTLPKNHGGEMMEPRDLVPAAVMGLVGIGLSIAGFVRTGWPPGGGALVIGLMALLLVVLGSMLLAWVVWWVRLAAHRVLRAVAETGSNPIDLSGVREGRGHAEGFVHAGDRELIAPLSGRPCVAFRIAGRMGDVHIDDALVAPMLLESEEGTFALRAQRWLAVLPVASRTSKLDGEQRARLRRFIESRGLRFAPDLEIGEAVIDDGDRVEAWGVSSSGVATYRDGVNELADSDGKPLVLQPK